MRKILHSFNMIEIVLAIGVVAFGVTAVMALLPPSLNANRDVAADAFVAEANSKVAGMLNLILIPKWKEGTDLPFPSSSTLPEPAVGIDKKDKSPDAPAEWKIFTTSVNGVYLFESGDGSTYLHASFRRADLPQDLYTGESDTISPTQPNNAQRIFVEFSWPVSSPVANRQKRLFAFDVLK